VRPRWPRDRDRDRVSALPAAEHLRDLVGSEPRSFGREAARSPSTRDLVAQHPGLMKRRQRRVEPTPRGEGRRLGLSRHRRHGREQPLEVALGRAEVARCGRRRAAAGKQSPPLRHLLSGEQSRVLAAVDQAFGIADLPRALLRIVLLTRLRGRFPQQRPCFERRLSQGSPETRLRVDPHGSAGSRSRPPGSAYGTRCARSRGRRPRRSTGTTCQRRR
jgi:hypothetical protein